MIKIPKDPMRTDPITGFSPKKKTFKEGTEKPAIEITIKKDIKIAAPPKRGVACWWTFLALADNPQILSVKLSSVQRGQDTGQSCTHYKETVN